MGRLHSAPYCSKCDNTLHIYSDNNVAAKPAAPSSFPKSSTCQGHRKPTALNSIIMWQWVSRGLLPQRGCTHTFTPTRSLQQQLYHDLLCECVQCSMFMDVVHKSLSGAEPSHPTSPLARFIWDKLQATKAWKGGGREHTGSLHHWHTHCTDVIWANAHTYLVIFFECVSAWHKHEVIHKTPGMHR